MGMALLLTDALVHRWQVLFWGMSAHWVSLLCEGLTQKMWLRSKGYKRTRGADVDLAALV
jgi:hypothetical protein